MVAEIDKAEAKIDALLDAIHDLDKRQSFEAIEMRREVHREIVNLNCDSFIEHYMKAYKILKRKLDLLEFNEAMPRILETITAHYEHRASRVDEMIKRHYGATVDGAKV